MKDLDQRLLEGLREMGSTAEPPAGLLERTRNRMVAYRRRVRIGAALVALATLVAAVTILPVVDRRARENGGTPSTVPGVPADPVVGHWTLLPSSPLSIDEQGPALSVWTGSEMIVWAEAEAAGARFDPNTSRWRRVSASPIMPRQGASAVWTGKEMLVWGGRSGDKVATDPGAAYNPLSDTWRPLPRPPIRLRADHSVVWTSTEMLVWGGTGSLPSPPHFADGAAYDPATNRWRRLPQAPLLRRAGHSAVWTGSEMVVWGGSEVLGRHTRYSDGSAYNPATRSWRPVTSSPLVARSDHTSVWTGREMVVWGGSGAEGPVSDGAAWDPAAGIWSTLPVAPLAPRAQHTAVWSGTEMVAWGGAGAGRRRFADGGAYNPVSGAWRRLPGVLLSSRFDHAATWTGSAMFVWGGRSPGDAPPADGAVFRLGPGPAKGANGAGGPGEAQPSRDTAASACLDKRRAQATPADAERFVEAFMRLRTIGAGAEECLSATALGQYRPELSARRDPASMPAPLCLYECGRAVVVDVRREPNWLKGSAGGGYTASVKIVLERPDGGTGGVTEYVIEEILTLGPGKTSSGRTVALVVQQVTTTAGRPRPSLTHP